jgi:uncharacterized lipoprotein YmbA
VIHFRSITRTGVLLFAAILLTGCIGGRSPAVQFHNLSPMVTASGAPGADPGPAIAVGPVIFPRSLRRSQVVIRTGPNSVELDEFHRWAGSLESDFLDALGSNLGALLSTDRVAVYPSEARFPLDYRVVLDVDRFDGSPGGTLVLSVRWTISVSDAAEAAIVKQSTIEQPVTGDTVDALVQAHDAAVAQLSRQIADQIRSL